MVLFAAQFGEFHLFLPFGKAGAVSVRPLVIAFRAGNAFREQRGQFVLRRNRIAAGVAQLRRPFHQAMTD